MPKSKIETNKNQINFRLKTKNYPLEAIYATAYVFINKAYVYLDGDPKKEMSVCLEGKEKLSEKILESLRGEFLNELLNYLLRVEIAKRNKKIRELIVSSALVSGLGGDFMAPVGGEVVDEKESWKADPLGIGVPWEEKYAEKEKNVSPKKLAKRRKRKLSGDKSKRGL
jgi:His-Xaa-Ser system protein HxsD